MKKRLVAGAGLLLLLAAGGMAGASPEEAPPGPPGLDRCGEASTTAQGAPGRRIPSLEEALGLNGTQQEKVEALLETERFNAAPIQKKLKECRRALREAEQAATLDEKGIRGIAAQQGELMTELIVLHAKSRHEIRLLLTPEQRARFERLPPPPGPPMPEGFPPPGSHRSGGREGVPPEGE